MKYFFINSSLNTSIVGDYNQVVEAKHHCDVSNETRFIDRQEFVKLNFEPIVSNAILTKKAVLTDLINAPIVGFSLKLLMSDKLKAIIEKYSTAKCQFFKSPVIYKGVEIDGYWILHPYHFDFDAIDYVHSKVMVRKRKPEGGTYLEQVHIANNQDFLIEELLKDKSSYHFISNLSIKEAVSSEFLILSNAESGIGYLASEKLKREIEYAGCTGVEFQPVELSSAEWLQGGEREKMYGKA